MLLLALNFSDILFYRISSLINIEMHLDENQSIDTYIDILKINGFNAWKDDKHWSSIMAVRKD